MATWGCFTPVDGGCPAARQDAQGSRSKQGVRVDRFVDAGYIFCDRFQSDIDIWVLRDQGALFVMTENEYNSVDHVEWLICCVDVVQRIEGVTLDVHDTDRVTLPLIDIRSQTGCRITYRRGDINNRGGGNLFSPLSPAVTAFLELGRQASDAIQCAEQREHTQ
jgi:hypothetical protein